MPCCFIASWVEEFLSDPFGVKGTHGTHSGILASPSPMWSAWLAWLAGTKTSRVASQNCPSAASYSLTDFLVSRNSHASSVGDALSLACGSGKTPSSVVLWTKGGCRYCVPPQSSRSEGEGTFMQSPRLSQRSQQLRAPQPFRVSFL